MLGPKGFVFAKAEEKYVVIPLDAGDYMWSKVEVYPQFAWLHASNRFRVVANSITYIGDTHVYVGDRGFSMRVNDGEAAMRAYLASIYPGYAMSMPVITALTELRL
jgi:hypothetical protein